MTEQRDALVAELSELRRQVEELRAAMKSSRGGRRLAVLALFGLAVAVAAGGTWLPRSEAEQDRREPPKQKDDKKIDLSKAGQDLVVSSLKIVGPDGKERVLIGYDNQSGYVKVCAPDG